MIYFLISYFTILIYICVMRLYDLVDLRIEDLATIIRELRDKK